MVFKMKLKLLIAICLPIITSAELMVDIEATTSKETSSVKLSGEDDHEITAYELTAYGMADVVLIKAVETLTKAKPDVIFTSGPTFGINAPKDNLYEEFGWEPVHVVYKGLWAENLNVDTEKVILNRQELENGHNTPTSFLINLDQSIEDELYLQWNSGVEIKDVPVTFNIKGSNVAKSFSYTGHWGENTTESMAKNIGGTASINVDLKPGQKAVVSLSATRYVLKCDILFQKYFHGKCAVNFPEKFEDHHYLSFDIDDVLKEANLPRTLQLECKTEVVYYANDEVEVETLGN